MLVGYTNTKVREHFSNNNEGKTIAELMHEKLDNNLDISIFIEFVYEKINYYTEIQCNSFKFGSNICESYKNKILDKYIQIDSNIRDYSYRFETYYELEPTKYQHEQIINRLIKDGFKFNRVVDGRNIYGELYYKNEITW